MNRKLHFMKRKAG